MYQFDVEKTKNACVAWIREFFEKNGPGCNAVVGISGGKDSSIVAALCVEALGKDRVIGVLMPCGEQHDIDMAELLVNHLGIRHFVVNIKDAVEGLTKSVPFELSEQSRVNLPPRIRMDGTLVTTRKPCAIAAVSQTSPASAIAPRKMMTLAKSRKPRSRDLLGSLFRMNLRQPSQ